MSRKHWEDLVKWHSKYRMTNFAMSETEPILWASDRLEKLERVAEAAKGLMIHAMPSSCECQACKNMREALRSLEELPDPPKEG